MSIKAIIILSLLPLIACDRKMDPFIIDGEHVRIERHPHAAFTGTSCLVNGEVSNWRCGASIITQNIVMTAAHCFDSCRNGIIKGILFHTGHENKNLGRKSSGHKFAIHSGYSSVISGYDIALVLLKTHLKLSAKCSRVALMKYPPYGEVAYVSGWGFVNVSIPLPLTYCWC
ncbi:trypsin-like [Bombyx mandarina]|uniref:Trypsin-like n=1 Tax=Bombyx mandarina TaxID=7092 RepID=A0A6J2JXR8_BOMMA|nr:trypsin-like [Bombyx mandarina]